MTVLNFSQFIGILLAIGPLIFVSDHNNPILKDNKHLSNPKSPEILNFAASRAMFSRSVSGTFAPNGPPIKSPFKVAAGKACIVDLVQAYQVMGTLSGTFEIDYRILVFGECGVPPGTYNEEWIAHGTFNGSIDKIPISGSLSYTAEVKAGGELVGRIIFGQGIVGELIVKGNFKNGKLSYSGWIDE